MRKFINDYDASLQPQIEKTIKPNLQKPLKGFLLTHSPVRQARKNLTIMEKLEKRNGSLVKMSPTKTHPDQRSYHESHQFDHEEQQQNMPQIIP